VSAGSAEIGYLCHHGHYCFHADPTEGGQCGSKRVGTVTLTFDDTDAPADWTEIVAAAQASLAEKYETWRHCKCSDEGVSDLIERGSLGTPEAKALRESVSDESVAKVMDRVREMDKCAHPNPRIDSDECFCGEHHRYCPDCLATLDRCSEGDKPYCPRCYEDVADEDDHLVGDKAVNCWYECPVDERPTS